MQDQIKFDGFEEKNGEANESKTKKAKKKTLKSNSGTVEDTKSKKSSSKSNSTKKEEKKTASKSRGSVKNKKTRTAKDDSPNSKNKTNRTQVRFTAEEMDMISELYDWYLSVRDNKALNPDISTSKKVEIEDDIIREKKRVSLNLDKEIWTDFEMIAENTGIKKNELLTQIISEFIKSHKDLF